MTEEETDSRSVRDRGDALKLCMFGAVPDTGNLGVTALCYATLTSIFAHEPKARVTVFDDGWGLRRGSISLGENEFHFDRRGARLSNRLHRPESYWNIRMSARLGGLANGSARALRSADAVLDISGGDSFTDLYGPKRFRGVTECKLMTLEQDVPLVLLPQTYGPFRDRANRELAGEIARRATMAWARDQRSFESLQELLGNTFDPARHLCGVDVAFALPILEPIGLDEQLKDRLATRSLPLVGVNISGLLFNDAKAATDQYGLKADYAAVVTGLVEKLLAESNATVLLIPHVVTQPGHYESDLAACEEVSRRIKSGSDRLMVAPAMDDPRQIKWLISKLDWFCGTRMHSTIAALSSGVAAAAIAYSPKTLGVFETCGQGDCVIDPRALDTHDVIAALWKCWNDRELYRQRLQQHLPGVKKMAAEQMGEIIAVCGGAQRVAPLGI